MITGVFIIFLVMALASSVVYGRNLIKTEKVDALFGNPERAKGGYHWIVAGSFSILLLWLYFSWDIARSFYPNSANEICQAAKVRDSLVPIKYIFPIEQRTLKSTAVVQRENKNIKKVKVELKELNIPNNNSLIQLLTEIELMMVSLADENNLEKTVIGKLDLISHKIEALTKAIQKEDYPDYQSLNDEEKEGLEKQFSWGATGMEVPFYPTTKRGVKLDAAAKEMKLIVEKFFLIKNDNPVFIKKAKTIKETIKQYKEGLKDSDKLEKEYIREIGKIAARITRSNIFPPKTLDNIEKAIRQFDYVQKKEQGDLGTIDTFLFPTGTIIASDSCSEQGTGRWLPKPTDTLRIFLKLLKPSEGYKNFPMLWYEMMGVNRIVGFIFPDWIADIIPGKFPVHSSDGTVKSNLKSTVLDIATGDFKAFSIPVPMGHIWDSFLRVFLGLVLGVIAGVPLGLFMGLSRFAKGYFDPCG